MNKQQGIPLRSQESGEAFLERVTARVARNEQLTVEEAARLIGWLRSCLGSLESNRMLLNQLSSTLQELH